MNFRYVRLEGKKRNLYQSMKRMTTSDEGACPFENFIRFPKFGHTTGVGAAFKIES